MHIAALSDVNSMIDFNDRNDRNRYGIRRQSSLSGSSVCPYASDSFCDDDDDYNDDDELIFQGYDRYDNDKLEFREDENENDRRYNFQHLLQQQSSPSLLDGACTNNNKGYNSIRSYYNCFLYIYYDSFALYYTLFVKASIHYNSIV